MKIYKDVYDKDDILKLDLSSEAKKTIEYLTRDEVEQILFILDDAYSESEMSEGSLSDFFWFETDTIADWLGYSSFDDIMERED